MRSTYLLKKSTAARFAQSMALVQKNAVITMRLQHSFSTFSQVKNGVHLLPSNDKTLSSPRTFPHKHKLHNGVISYVHPKAYAEDKKWIDPDLIDRRTITGEIGMRTSHLLSIMAPGEDLHVDQLPLDDFKQHDESAKKVRQSYGKISIRSAEVDVFARWFTPDVKPANTDNNANIFGQYGCFELVDYCSNLELPAVDLECLSDTDLQLYRATRLTPEYSFYPKFNTFDKNLYILVDDYSENYLVDYALQEKLGGGWFIETHNFPHLFQPLSPECGGAAILGRLISRDEKTGISHYKLISIKINYPEAIVIESEVIHGNASFIGPYAISSTSAGNASIVVMRTPDGKMQSVTQPAAYQNPHRLFKQQPEMDAGAEQVEKGIAATMKKNG